MNIFEHTRLQSQPLLFAPETRSRSDKLNDKQTILPESS